MVITTRPPEHQADGHAVTASHRDEGGRDRALAELGEQRQLTFVRCDVTDEASVVVSLPSLAVVNLVGFFASGPRVHEASPEDLDRMLKLNLIPSFRLARAAVPRLLEIGGSFITIASSSVRKPFLGTAGNLVSKAALITLISSRSTSSTATRRSGPTCYCQ